MVRRLVLPQVDHLLQRRQGGSHLRPKLVQAGPPDDILDELARQHGLSCERRGPLERSCVWVVLAVIINRARTLADGRRDDAAGDAGTETRLPTPMKLGVMHWIAGSGYI